MSIINKFIYNNIDLFVEEAITSKSNIDGNDVYLLQWQRTFLSKAFKKHTYTVRTSRQIGATTILLKYMIAQALISTKDKILYTVRTIDECKCITKLLLDILTTNNIPYDWIGASTNGLFAIGTSTIGICTYDTIGGLGIPSIHIMDKPKAPSRYTPLDTTKIISVNPQYVTDIDDVFDWTSVPSRNGEWVLKMIEYIGLNNFNKVYGCEF